MKKLLAFMGIFCLIVPLVFLGCEGSDGAPGAPGAKGDTGDPGPGVGLQVEQCVICHGETGTELHALYQELYQDGVILVSDVQVTVVDNDTVTTTFSMTKDGADFDCRDADTLGAYWIAYTDNNTFEMPNGARFTLAPTATSGGSNTKTYDGSGGCTITATYNDNVADLTGSADFTGENGLVIVYGADEQVGSLPARIRQVKYPFEAIVETPAPGTVTYLSAANNAGCEKCHSTPYLKHGYIYGQFAGDPATDFWACKACHLDNGEGGHFEWELSVNDPPLWAAFMGGQNLTPAQEAQYAYRTTLMNDVHRSHAMEFPYPQSMSNCVVCHEEKLDSILTAANFKAETCKSCHPVDGSDTYTGGIAGANPYLEADSDRPPTNTLALNTIIPHAWDESTVCSTCHTDGSAIAFSAIHTGYDKVIYTDNGVKFSSIFVVTIDNASFDNNVLTFEFSATGSFGGITADNIVPTVMVGLYGWNTKDYIQGPHESDPAGNQNQRTPPQTLRALEYDVGSDSITGRNSPYITVTGAGGSWEATVDLSYWAGLIAADNVTKVEIAIMPELMNADNVVLALNAPSKTFNLGTNAFVNNYYSGTNALVKVASPNGCNDCHEALARTFHTPDRGGSIVVCRLCHITKSGGSHLEMQSRSIDSYAHAIHSFQAFDINQVDFNDPVYALHYEHHIEFPYPKHGITDCESCHNAGKYNAPDQTKSMPGLLSSAESNAILAANGFDRNIGDVPSYVTGPGSRACGSCHRAVAIKEDNAGELDIINSHVGSNNFGYLLDASDYDVEDVIYSIMALFP